MADIIEGSRVVLLEDAEEGWPREFGEVLGIDELDWGTSLVVQVDDEYRDGEMDDGLREVTIEQVRLESELN